MRSGIHVNKPDQLFAPKFPNGRGFGFGAVDPVDIDRTATD